MSYINYKWKGIAKENTAFCILGGPSVNQIKNIDEIIKNNFTVAVNHNIKLYPNSDMFITGDSMIAREYFESKEFFVHKFQGGKLLKNQSNFTYEESPQWITGKKHIIEQNPDLIKIIGCNDFPICNYSFTTGQLYKLYGEEYCRQTKNTYLCIEYRNPQGESWPLLSPSIQETLDNYGKDPNKLYPGGNISGIMFQLLYYMGFSKVIVVGYGDIGESAGYQPGTEFEWSNEEIHALVTHNKIWGDNLKVLHGGELCKKYTNFQTASYSELETSPTKKQQLIQKLLKI